MQVKEIKVSRSDLGFRPKSEDFPFINEQIKMWLRIKRDRPLEGERYICQNTRINCKTSFKRERNSSKIPGGCFTVGVSFEPSVDISRGLVGQILDQVNQTTGLNLQQTRRDDSVRLIPSGLKYFRDDWTYVEGWHSFFKGGGEEPNKEYHVRVEFVGNPNEKQQRELLKIGDKIYVPRKSDSRGYKSGSDQNKVFGKYSFGGNFFISREGIYPIMHVDKVFEGDISKESEKNIRDFYHQIRDYLLESKMSERCIGTGGEQFGEELWGVKRLDLQEIISSSDLGKVGKHSPRIAVAFFYPNGEVKVDRSKGLPLRYMDTALIRNSQFSPEYYS